MLKKHGKALLSNLPESLGYSIFILRYFVSIVGNPEYNTENVI